MTPPVNALTWVGAALPIAFLLFLLVIRKWPAVQAAAAAMLIAMLIAFFLYDAPLSVIGAEIGKGVWNSISIIIVIIPAIMIYEVSREINGFAAIQRDLSRLIPHKLLQILAIGWCFTSFLQGPSGFGVPVAVAAPLLIGIGLKPFWSVVIPLMAHAWGNTFGTLSLGWETLAQQTSLATNPSDYWQAAWWVGILTGLWCILGGFFICWFYRGFNALKQGWPAVLILGSIMAGGQLLLTQATPMLCLTIPATVGLGAVMLMGKMPRYSVEDKEHRSLLLIEKSPENNISTTLTLHEALLPYYILVGISIIVLLVPAIKNFLGTWKMSIALPMTETGFGFINDAYPVYGQISPFTHSGFFLLLATIFSTGYFISKGFIKEGGIKRIIDNSVQKAIPPTVAVVLLLVMSKVMTGSGQVAVLAQGTAFATGDFYAILCPMVGTLGAFMSSSNVSSNILFGQFQESMAIFTNRDIVLFLAAQTSGAALGCMFSPSNVLLGTTTAGIVGQEGEIIKKLLSIALIGIVLMGIITFFFS